AARADDGLEKQTNQFVDELAPGRNRLESNRADQLALPADRFPSLDDRAARVVGFMRVTKDRAGHEHFTARRVVPDGDQWLIGWSILLDDVQVPRRKSLPAARLHAVQH